MQYIITRLWVERSKREVEHVNYDPKCWPCLYASEIDGRLSFVLLWSYLFNYNTCFCRVKQLIYKLWILEQETFIAFPHRKWGLRGHEALWKIWQDL